MRQSTIDQFSMTTRNQHWDRLFKKRSSDASLGWWEKNSFQTLKFVDQTELDIPSTIFLAGAGTSMLAGDLLVRGHNLIINEISSAALSDLQERIGPNRRAAWLLHDLGQPLLKPLPPIDLWIDRAVLHFLIEENHIQHYFANLQKAVRPGGHALLAQFSADGAPRCADLDLHRYSLDELRDRTDSDFHLVDDESYLYRTPGGAPRPFLYALFRKHI